MPGIDEVKDLQLSAFVESGRSVKLGEYDAYFRASQYESKRYDWDGRMVSANPGDAFIQPGFYVPLSQRKPSSRIDMGRKITRRFTAMTLGGDRFAKIAVHGDDEAEDWCQELMRVSQMNSKFIEARNKGGACGTAVLSWAFIDGKPRIKVHSAHRMFVMRWVDYDMRKPGAVLETYRYERTVVEEGKPVRRPFFYARVWTEQDETIWSPIPEPLAKDGSWWKAVPSVTVTHSFGFCPVYWIQNLPDSDNDDGESDFEGQLTNFDDMSQLASQLSKGTKGNVDPTLVVKDDPQQYNKGSIRKGSENAIYSKGGADYLTMPGDAIQAALDWLRELRNESAETSNVVFPSPSDLTGAKSAAALRVLYGPMLTQCDQYRTQYGDFGIAPMVRDMLAVSRSVFNGVPGKVFTTAEGQRIQQQPTIVLDDRIIEEKDEDGKVKQTTKKRSPGTSSAVVLNWPPYFPDTWADIALAVEASVKATGGRPILSVETAVKNIAPKFGAENAEEELERIGEDADDAEERAQAQFDKQLEAESLYGGTGSEAQGKPKGKSDDE